MEKRELQPGQSYCLSSFRKNGKDQSAQSIQAGKQEEIISPVIISKPCSISGAGFFLHIITFLFLQFFP